MNVWVRAFDQRNYTYSTKIDTAGAFIIRNVPSSGGGVIVRLIVSALTSEGTVIRTSAETSRGVPVGIVNFPLEASTLSLKDVPANRQPLVIAPRDLRMNQGEIRDVLIYADDPDTNETLQVSVSGPQGTSISVGANGAFTVRLAPKSAGTFTVRVSATDSQGAIVAQDIALTVTGANTTPTVTVPGAQSAKVGQTLSFNVSATDPDAGQTITLVATNMPQGSTFTPAAPVGTLTGTFSWTPAANQVGTYTVTFTATDNANPPLSDVKTVTITVAAQAQEHQ
jgi:hypothetical protein